MGALLNFHRGGALDAQALGSDPGYGNYAFGAYNAASGLDLPTTLGLANAYAALRSAYKAGTPMDKNYPYVPADNIANISRGYNDYQNKTYGTRRKSRFRSQERGIGLSGSGSPARHFGSGRIGMFYFSESLQYQ